MQNASLIARNTLNFHRPYHLMPLPPKYRYHVDYHSHHTSLLLPWIRHQSERDSAPFVPAKIAHGVSAPVDTKSACMKYKYNDPPWDACRYRGSSLLKGDRSSLRNGLQMEAPKEGECCRFCNALDIFTLEMLVQYFLVSFADCIWIFWSFAIQNIIDHTDILYRLICFKIYIKERLVKILTEIRLSMQYWIYSLKKYKIYL